MTEGQAGSQGPAGPLRIAAVVVTHDRLAQLQVTLARLLAEPVDHVVVVDNASTDGTGAWLAQGADARLHVIRLGHNGGGAGGFEVGVRQAVALFDPDWCLVMDDDARPEAGAVARFRAMDVAGLGGVAAAVYAPDGSICDMNRPWVNPFWDRATFWRTLRGGRRGFHVPDAAYDAAGVTAIDGGSFVGLFISRAAIAATGLPDGRMFIYGDDVMYTLAMRRAGQRIAFAPGVRFEHDFKTFDTGSRAFRPLWKTYYHHRNLLFVYHSAAGVLFWPALMLILPKWLIKARFYGDDRAVYLKLLGLALWDGLRGKLNRTHAQVVALASRGG